MQMSYSDFANQMPMEKELSLISSIFPELLEVVGLTDETSKEVVTWQ